MSNSWVERHRPDSWSDIQGNNSALEDIQDWVENWSKGDAPQLLVGPPGVGKTTTAQVASDAMGYPINQINASSARRSEDISRIVRSMRSKPVSSDHQLILLDEVDSWHHSVDKSDLYDALRDAQNPIILTANDKYDVPDSIKRSSDVHEFKLSKPSRRAKLKEIAEREGLDLDKQDLNTLAERPDLRSAINDLQTWSESGTPPGKNHRTSSEDEFPAIQSLLKDDKRAWRDALSPQSDTFRDPGSALLWADENLSEEFRGLEAGIAYDTLSRADRHLGRARGSSDYSYWKYASALIEMLPETRLTSPYQGYIDVGFPEWFRSSESSHDDGSPEAELFQALKPERGYRMAGSFFEFRKQILPILKQLDDEEKKEFALDHGLDADAIEALGLDPDDFEEWREIESPEEGDGWSPDSQSAMDAGW